MGNSLHKLPTLLSSNSTTYDDLRVALIEAVRGDRRSIAFPEQRSYRSANVGCNLDIIVKPIAIIFPRKIDDVQDIVRTAVKFGLNVQARSGGHSYGNHALGGTDGTIVIDLRHFQYVSVDQSTWIATIGAGARLDEVIKQLHANGKRAIAHGTCPSVGIGGHATIGGLGPTSRIWGTTVDHIQEMAVVLADGNVVIASDNQNKDLFFVMRGAGAGFGIAIEFKFRTRLAPDEAVHFSCTLSGRYSSMTETFKDWQAIVTNPGLNRKLFSQVIITTLGMNITGTFLGTEDEFRLEPFAHRFVYSERRRQAIKRAGNDSVQCIYKPECESSSSKREPTVKVTMEIYKNNWLGLIRQWAGGWFLSKLLGRPSHFYHKSLAIDNGQQIAADSIDKLFQQLDNAKKATPMWFVIFDLAGGAVNDVPVSATAFPHRSVSIYCQSYAISIGRVAESSKEFIRKVNETVVAGIDTQREANIYSGYVDPELKSPQRQYWCCNLERLECIKAKYDPGDVFRNPQSVRPERE